MYWTIWKTVAQCIDEVQSEGITLSLGAIVAELQLMIDEGLLHVYVAEGNSLVSFAGPLAAFGIFRPPEEDPQRPWLAS